MDTHGVPQRARSHCKGGTDFLRLWIGRTRRSSCMYSSDTLLRYCDVAIVSQKMRGHHSLFLS
jgi:hypothetical protein